MITKQNTAPRRASINERKFFRDTILIKIPFIIWLPWNTYYKFHNQKDRVRNLQCFHFMGVHKQGVVLKDMMWKVKVIWCPLQTPPPPPGIPICYLAYSRKHKTTAQPSVEERNEFKTNLTWLPWKILKCWSVTNQGDDFIKCPLSIRWLEFHTNVILT